NPVACDAPVPVPTGRTVAICQGPQPDLALGRPSSRDRGVDGFPNRRVIVRIAEHVAPVDDDGEASSHAMPEAEPNSARGLEADDLNPKARAELPDEAFGELVRALRVLAELVWRLATFLVYEGFDAHLREWLGTGRPARLV